ncbi:prohead core [Vibrio phage YC]|uniref:Prohead core n=1 Tax=Vibrio phage YC TaxID=2267403 RepID=A0A384ZSA1_9CAUD|nr:prohead core [Vibrio phage YC]AXC34518.1 prohead core [Vibrio phage YC]
MDYTFENFLVEAYADHLDEAFIKKVNSRGEVTKRKATRDGEKLVNGKKQRMSSAEQRNRSKGAKRGAKKRRTKQGQINRKREKAMSKRKQKGL